MIRKNSVESLDFNHCCGCRLCADICPKESITFEIDYEGFYYPKVNTNTCIDCGLCYQKCPELNQAFNNESKFAISAIAKDKAIHNQGSSGGVFPLLAKFVLNQNGKVYGAAFDDVIQLKHIGIDKTEDLSPLCKSKYLQSDCSGIYIQIIKELKDGKKILFCGTPCQCQALNNAIENNKYRNNLILIDFVCHGVSCQKLFDDNIRYYSKKYGKILSYQFRNKEKAKYHQSFSISYNNGSCTKTLKGTYYKDPYYYGYERRITLSPACYNCKWATLKRCSDITMSDFFGITDRDSRIKDNYVSCVFCNTKEGLTLFNEIKADLNFVHNYPVELAREKNECLRHPVKMPNERNNFFKSWITLGFNSVRKEYLSPKHKLIYDLFYAIPINIRKLIR